MFFVTATTNYPGAAMPPINNSYTQGYFDSEVYAGSNVPSNVTSGQSFSVNSFTVN